LWALCRPAAERCEFIARGGAHVERPFRDTPEIGSLRLGCAHPCAQTVPEGAFDMHPAAFAPLLALGSVGTSISAQHADAMRTWLVTSLRGASVGARGPTRLK